jgi:hypothetical protein
MKRFLQVLMLSAFSIAVLIGGLITFHAGSPTPVYAQAAVGSPAKDDAFPVPVPPNPPPPLVETVLPASVKERAEVPELLVLLRQIRDQKTQLARAEQETIAKIKTKLKKYGQELDSLERELSALGVPEEKKPTKGVFKETAFGEEKKLETK